MSLTLAIIAALALFAVCTIIAAGWTAALPEFVGSLRPSGQREPKRYSPKSTLFVIAPSEDHHAGVLQRRLLKPALATLIHEEIAIMEIYGEKTPRENGVLMKWLDASLLRHAMDAADGFYVIYVDKAGRTVVRSDAPMTAAAILAEIRPDAQTLRRRRANRSRALKKLGAA